MNALDSIFSGATRSRRLVIPYLCAGDPDLATTGNVVRALGRAGAQIVEIGIPFSDPVGDGETIIAASQRALRSGTTVACTLDLCKRLPERPAIVLLTYLNPIAAYGLRRFASDARDAGIYGVIVADLPYEEASIVAEPLRGRGVALILLISPTTPLDRAVQIADASDGFAYVVSRLGVTGAARQPNLDALVLRLQALRRRTSRPLAVGFGISNASQVQRIGRYAHATVLGSALIEILEGLTGAEAANAACAFYEPLLAAARGDDNPESSTLMRSTSVR
jgi:tryptophan synthase alpha chain